MRDAAGVLKYYDVTFKLQLNATGVPVLAPLNPVVSLSPNLNVGKFVAGKYKDAVGNIYSVSGPGIAPDGRTTWGLVLTKKSTSSLADHRDALSASWTTGKIVGHPNENTLKSQGITSETLSWGTVTGFIYSSQAYFPNCGGYEAVGATQTGNLLSLNGFCFGDTRLTDVLTLNLCTASNPCP